MSRPYSPHSDTAPTHRFDESEPPPGPLDDEHDYAPYEDYDDEPDVVYYDEPIDRRWIWVAGVAVAILLVAVICTVVILSGGDSGSVSAPVSSAAPTTSRPATTSAPPVASSTPAPPPAPPLPPETVTTVTPSAPASASPPPSAAPPAPAPAPNTVTYRVTGTRPLVDLVTIIYTDQRGALQTEVNVALPWAKTLTLDPGVTLSSVTATSVGGQLNCAITDGAGATMAQESNNGIIATCTK